MRAITALPTATQLKELLDETGVLLRAAHQHQSNGHVHEAGEYLRRAQVRCVALARFLEEQLMPRRSKGTEPMIEAIALKRPRRMRTSKSAMSAETNVQGGHSAQTNSHGKDNDEGEEEEDDDDESLLHMPSL